MGSQELGSTGARERLAVAVDASWFRVDDEPPVALGRRKLLRSLLDALVELRERSPGAAYDVRELIARVWPADRAPHVHARNRLYVALHELRRLGLRDALVRTSDGWMVGPDVRVERAVTPPD